MLRYKDLEDVVYRKELIYDETIDILDINYIAGSTNRYILPSSILEISDLNLMLKSLFYEVKANKTIDYVKLRSNLTTNKTLKFTRKNVFLHNTRFYSIPFKSFS